MRVNAARSDARGTTLPRGGFFPGVRAPDYRTAVIEGELSGTSSASETTIRSWPEPRECQTTQTPPGSSITGHLLPVAWLQSSISVVRSTDVAYAFLSDKGDLTDSPWQELRRTVQPLRVAADALLEDIHDTLRRERDTSGWIKHAGLAAVARLIDVLGLNRPTILRMGAVPTSTFYAWQKSPHSVIRTPTVTRLLRLQAQVAILDEALGRDHMRSWVLSAGRLDRLQGDDAAFAEVLTEAETALAETTRITPRPRMRFADYASGPSGTLDDQANVSSGWPGATQIPEGGTR